MHSHPNPKRQRGKPKHQLALRLHGEDFGWGVGCGVPRFMLRRATKHEKNDARFRFAKGICQRSSVGYRRVATAIHQLRKAKSECAQSTDSQRNNPSHSLAPR